MNNPIGYSFPVVGDSADNVHITPLPVIERAKNTRSFLHNQKRKDCKKQLAVFADIDGSKQLYGFVNIYKDCAYWHDVTTSYKPGRPEKLVGITDRLPLCVMRDKTGIIDESVHIYATRF